MQILVDVSGAAKIRQNQRHVMTRTPALGIPHSWILIAFSVRLSTALLLETFFQPDEYYQALEPALYLASGGKLGWLTWEWSKDNAIRSWIFPGFIAFLYRIGNAICSPELLRQWYIHSPKVAVALLSATGDIACASLTGRILGRDYMGTAVSRVTKWRSPPRLIALAFHFPRLMVRSFCRCKVSHQYCRGLTDDDRSQSLAMVRDQDKCVCHLHGASCGSHPSHQRCDLVHPSP